jgi:2'-5' RNA ligase
MPRSKRPARNKAASPAIEATTFRTCARVTTGKPSFLVSRRLVIAYWFIPAEPARSFFQTVINDLARRHDAPTFEPHVTVFVGANRVRAANDALFRAARDCHRIKLTTAAIGQSSEFIKTLFIEFALNDELRQLNKIMRDAAQDSSQYELKPHLSLLYKKLPDAVRRELADSINVPFSEARFDTLKAIQCVSPTQSRADVEAWQELAAADLPD